MKKITEQPKKLTITKTTLGLLRASLQTHPVRVHNTGIATVLSTQPACDVTSTGLA